MKRFLHRHGFLAAASLLATVLLTAFLWSAFFGPNDFKEAGQKIFFVSKGQTFASIVDSLVSQGLVRHRQVFVMVARVYGGSHRVQVGRYIFSSGVSNSDLFLALRSGQGNSLITVSVPEGYRSRSQARLFSRMLGVDSARFVRLVNDPGFVRSLGIDGASLEGYLLPDTYSFSWQQEEEEILRRMVGQFTAFYGESLRARQQDLGWTTCQVLALASIVEGEAVMDDERPVISGVYHNRLRKGMKLEADPTIQFIIQGSARRLLYADLKLDSPYNTYMYKGLPPGPVNNPGRASIVASLFPAQHPYVFFVANGRGGHWFSSSYDEHLRHVRMYRKLRAKLLSAR